MLDESSLAATLDAVNEALFFGRTISQRDRAAVAKWLAAQCDEPHAYAAMPAPTPQDFAAKPALFTGEPLTSGGGTACKLGNEGCRALILLGVHTRPVAAALQRAEEQMIARLGPVAGPRAGTYCCGSCSVAVWRHLLAGGLDHQEERLATGLQHLRRARRGDGAWGRFPVWYTLWSLTEMDPALVRDELQYAAPRLERALKRQPRPDDVIALRRQEVARRALALV